MPSNLRKLIQLDHMAQIVKNIATNQAIARQLISNTTTIAFGVFLDLRARSFFLVQFHAWGGLFPLRPQLEFFTWHLTFEPPYVESILPVMPAYDKIKCMLSQYYLRCLSVYIIKSGWIHLPARFRKTNLRMRVCCFNINSWRVYIVQYYRWMLKNRTLTGEK